MYRTFLPQAGPGAPNVWLEAGIHAREWIAPAVATFIMRELVWTVKISREWPFNTRAFYQGDSSRLRTMLSIPSTWTRSTGTSSPQPTPTG